VLCNPTTAGTCRNASSYVFFDGVHPSEAANVFMAESMVEAGIDLQTIPVAKLTILPCPRTRTRAMNAAPEDIMPSILQFT